MELVKLPVESVVIITGFVAIALLSYDIVIPELAAKLLPVTVTVVPAGPLVGLSEIDADGGGGGGVVTVNCAEAEFDTASLALTV